MDSYTPEQMEAAKIANAHGFINQRIHDAGRTPEEAQADLKKAHAIQEKIASQIPKVIEVVREHLKAGGAAAPAAA
jgi:hypothetical protein